jgi:hypothetical protein
MRLAPARCRPRAAAVGTSGSARNQRGRFFWDCREAAPIRANLSHRQDWPDGTAASTGRGTLRPATTAERHGRLYSIFADRAGHSRRGRGQCSGRRAGPRGAGQPFTRPALSPARPLSPPSHRPALSHARPCSRGGGSPAAKRPRGPGCRRRIATATSIAPGRRPRRRTRRTHGTGEKTASAAIRSASQACGDIEAGGLYGPRVAAAIGPGDDHCRECPPFRRASLRHVQVGRGNVFQAGAPCLARGRGGDRSQQGADQGEFRRSSLRPLQTGR